MIGMGSLSKENFGCVQSSVFRSIHGNLIIWYGAWQKRSRDEKEKLTANIKSMLTDVTRMAVLVDHSFLDAYAGESRDGSSMVKLCTGDIISMISAVTATKDLNDFCYAVLAIFRSRFAKTEGMSAGLCLKGQDLPCVVSIHVWKSLQSCYSWVLNSEQRKSMMPYLEGFSIDMKYDIFRVVYVSGDNVENLLYVCPHHQLMKNEEEIRQGQAMQN